MADLDKWMEIARQNFSDNQLHIWLKANKAFQAFQGSRAALNEDSYRAKAAILNALLLHYLDLSDTKFLNSKKIATLLNHLDRLVLQASTLVRERQIFRTLDNLVKCLLYMRLGDFIIGFALTDNSSSKSRLQRLSLYSYAMAYEWAHKEFENLEDVDPLFALCLAELQTLINARDLDSPNMLSRSNDKLYSFIAEFSESHLDEQASFILRDQTYPAIAQRNYNIEEHLIKLSWPIHKNVYYLRRLIWLFSNNAELENNIYRFLDELLNALPTCPDDLDDACSPESTSIVDLKIFLFRLSRYLKCSFDADFVVPPWMFYRKPNSNQQKFWEAVTVLLDDKRRGTKNIDLQLLMSLTNYLEQIRNPEASSTSTDPNSLAETEGFIRRMKALKGDYHTFCGILLQRYLVAIGTTTPETDWVFVLEESDDAGSDQRSGLHFDSYQEHAGQHLPTDYDEKKDSISANADDLTTHVESKYDEPFSAQITTSTQTDLQEPGQSVEEVMNMPPPPAWTLMAYETNLQIARLIKHNEILIKLFR